MRYALTFLLAAASMMATDLPSPATLIDQTFAQARSQSLAERYAGAIVPANQTALEPTRELEYRRIEEDLQKWFRDTVGLTSKSQLSRPSSRSRIPSQNIGGSTSGRIPPKH
jgi:hypothetical protein